MSASVGELLRAARQRLDGHSPTADIDARVLMAHCLRKPASFLFTWPEHIPTDSEARQFQEWVARRVVGEPVAYLIGRREFYGHEFLVSPDTLIPRPDTELLVDTVLEGLAADAPLRVADLGTGTGAIAISLALARPAWQLVAVDTSTAILDLVERNRQRLGAGNVQPLQSNWCSQLPGPLDAVVSNPPYIPDDDPHLGEGDVRYEPRTALAAGSDGLADIRVITVQSRQRLRPGGLLALEHGYDQGEAVQQILRDAGFVRIETRRDLAGHDRVTLGITPPGDADAQ
ncbi:peptide chain release factor N(5)-glutamine methyltransferase [Isoalcanivorax indicus]|uniref:peptide chain release factor N(5)-glutamine methyltransferase n=1 Tax=Isoalcanivorax indicus TaxID=2202653 RepID=UPI000DB9EB4C|nr:peptide chain release factor N(5)-glutamine methyltransferase [Isoalcanivorax indicus]